MPRSKNPQDRYAKTFELMLEKGSNPEAGPGYLLTRDVLKAQINTAYLYKFIKGRSGIRRICRGVYVLEGTDVDYCYVISLHSEGIFSYDTALWLHGLTDQKPGMIDITLPYGYNKYQYKNEPGEEIRKPFIDNWNILIHITYREWFEEGIMSIPTPYGHTVCTYEKEKIICNMIRRLPKDSMILPGDYHFDVLHNFFRGEYNGERLEYYAAKMDVTSKVRRIQQAFTTAFG